jgi:microcystin-dependent protein
MSTPYIGEIKMFGGNFAIQGWAFCDGSLLPISENDALFILIGTTYGGDGQTTFALPNLQGRVPVHQGTGPGLTTRIIGEAAGTETVTITPLTTPAHSHIPQAGTGGSGVTQSANPANNVVAGGIQQVFSPTLLPVTTKMGTTIAGGSQPHENMAPFLTVTFLISLFGIFPTQS